MTSPKHALQPNEPSLLLITGFHVFSGFTIRAAVSHMFYPSREEAEIFNLWTAYLNMEVAYGDEATTKEIFQRACGNADSLKVHKQMAAIFSEADKVEVGFFSFCFSI